MSWQTVLGHERIRDQFAVAVAQDRLASTFLFLGPAGIGKRTFAIKLAETLLCPRALDFEPCGTCPSCRQMAAGSHPDLHYVCRAPEKSQITLEQLVGDRSDRSGLCQQIAMKSFYGGRRVAILDDADDLRQEGANALLKTLEEPPPGSVIILIGTAEQRQLPTIRSRCQIVRFVPLHWQLVEQLLVERALVSPPEMAHRLARCSGGSVQASLRLFDEEVLAFRTRWLEQLTSRSSATTDFIKDVQSFVERAGKEAPARRRRLVELANWAAELYRLAAAVMASGEVPAPVASHPDEELRALAVECARQWPSSLDSLTQAMDRCLLIESQTQANAHLVTLLESWLLDLNQAALGQVPFYPSLADSSPLR
jgi:DNA polymerase-3 subunit delta'